MFFFGKLRSFWVGVVTVCLFVVNDGWECLSQGYFSTRTCWLDQFVFTCFLSTFSSFTDLPTGWEEGYTFEGARCFIKWVTPSLQKTHTYHNLRTCLQYTNTPCEFAAPPHRQTCIYYQFYYSKWRKSSFKRCFTPKNMLHIESAYCVAINLEPLLLIAGQLRPTAEVNDCTGTLCKYEADMGKVWWLLESCLFIQTHSAPELSRLGDLSQSIMCTLFMTVIKLSKKTVILPV